MRSPSPNVQLLNSGRERSAWNTFKICLTVEKELSKIMQKLALSSKEIGDANLDLGNVNLGLRECQTSLVGRVMGEKLSIL